MATENGTPAHGHKKFGMASITAVGGIAAGQEVIKFAWDQMAAVALYNGFPLTSMADEMAANIVTICVLGAFYWTREQ
jgi:hypothetical protein